MIRYFRYIVLILVISGFALVLPWAYNLLFKPVTQPVLVSYSLIRNDFVINKKEGHKTIYTTTTGDTLTRIGYYQSLPLLFYRSLEKEGLLPDTLNNEKITLANLRKHNYFYKLFSYETNSPDPPAAHLFESSDEAAHFRLQNNFFTYKSRIDFINLNKDSTVNSGDLFTKALTTIGAEFPVKHIFGDSRPQKNYDFGYYIVDKNGHLFTLKMTHGEPVAEVLKIPPGLDIEFIKPIDPVNQEILAIIISKNDKIFLHLGLSNTIVPTNITDYNPDTDDISLFGNSFFKSFTISKPAKRELFILDDNYHITNSYKYELDPVGFKRFYRVKSLLFPFEISFKNHKNSIKTLALNISETALVLIPNFLWTLIYVFFRNKRRSLSDSLIIFITGIYGFIGCWFINKN